jgi:hypothetical protein
MGWTGLWHKPHSIPDYFKERWEGSFPGKDGKLIKTKCLGQAFVGRNVLYGVWERQWGDEKPFQYATVVLCDYHKDGSCEFFYKDMDETVGPSEARMPLTLLKKLKTPAGSEYARAWRKACWQHALGLTKAGAICKAKRYWRRNREKAVEILEAYNARNPENKIKYAAY